MTIRSSRSDVTSGAVRIGGADVRRIVEEALYRQVGFVFQDTYLLRTTIRDNAVSAHGRAVGMGDADIARLWNVGLGVYPAIPTSPSIAWLAGALPERSRKRLYPVLVSLQSILHTVTRASGDIGGLS